MNTKKYEKGYQEVAFFYAVKGLLFYFFATFRFIDTILIQWNKRVAV